MLNLFISIYLKAMTIFLTLGVYGINVANIFPLQSDYIPTITIYYIMGITYTFLCLLWFVCAEYLRSKDKIPYVLIKVAAFGTIICFCSFRKSPAPPKIPSKALEEDANKIEIKEGFSCRKCEVCDKCLKQKDTENKKADETKQKVSHIKALNYMVFWFILLAQLVTYLGIWVSLGSNSY